MKGWRFYLEFENRRAKRKGQHSGNVFALYHGEGIESPEVVSQFRYHLEGFGAVFFYPDSPVCWTGADRDYIRENTKRIPERLAREIHPALFERLDAEE